MNERRDRIEDALRSSGSATPPDGLDRRIKDDIPEIMGTGSDSGPRTPFWSLAAALVLLVAGGWFAARMLGFGEEAPVARIASERSPQAADAADPERALEAQSSEPEEMAMARQESFLEMESKAIAAEPEPVAPAETIEMADAARRTDDARREKREQEQDGDEPSAEQVAVVDRAVAAIAARPMERPAAPPPPPAPPAAIAESSGQSGRSADRARALEEMATTTPAEAAKTGTGTVRQEGGSAATALSWDEVRDSILNGDLPSPRQIDLDLIVDHFDYGDRPPRRRGRISLFMEGGGAPLSPGRWRTIRIGVTSGSSTVPVASDAILEVRFNPAVVSIYRELGELTRIRTSERAATEESLGTIPGEFRASRLFLVKLEPDVDLDQIVAEAVLRFSTENREEEHVDRNLRIGHVSPTWETTTRSLQLATLAAALAEYLAERHQARTGVDLVFLANNLAAAAEDDPDAEELVRVVRRSVELRLLR